MEENDIDHDQKRLEEMGGKVLQLLKSANDGMNLSAKSAHRAHEAGNFDREAAFLNATANFSIAQAMIAIHLHSEYLQTIRQIEDHDREKPHDR